MPVWGVYGKAKARRRPFCAEVRDNPLKNLDSRKKIHLDSVPKNLEGLKLTRPRSPRFCARTLPPAPITSTHAFSACRTHSMLAWPSPATDPLCADHPFREAQSPRALAPSVARARAITPHRNATHASAAYRAGSLASQPVVVAVRYATSDGLWNAGQCYRARSRARVSSSCFLINRKTRLMTAQTAEPVGQSSLARPRPLSLPP